MTDLAEHLRKQNCAVLYNLCKWEHVSGNAILCCQYFKLVYITDTAILDACIGMSLLLWFCSFVTIAAFVKLCVWLPHYTKTLVILVFRCGFPLGFSSLMLQLKPRDGATGAPDKHNCRHEMTLLHESLCDASTAESSVIKYVDKLLKAFTVSSALLVTYAG